MKRIRRAKTPKATHRRKSKSLAASELQTLRANWCSVIADAEERIIQLRRSIEWAKRGRERLRAASGESTMRYQRALQQISPECNYALSIWAR